MWIEGGRRGGARQLSKHLRRTDENESVRVIDIEGFAFSTPTLGNLNRALRQMETNGFAKGCKKNLFHVKIAPAYGYGLSKAELEFAVKFYIEQQKLQGHQYVLVEHWKKGKAHFHLVFDIINQDTRKIHELKFSKRNDYRISRELEKVFGHPTPTLKGKAIKVWEQQRSKRTEVDAIKLRKDITDAFYSSKNAREFMGKLEKAGVTLTRTKERKLVLVDKAGETHGLMRNIDDARIADLRRKFPGIARMSFSPYEEMVRERKAAATNTKELTPSKINPDKIKNDVRRAHRLSSNGAEFFSRISKRGYTFGRDHIGFAVIDRNGGRHDMATLLGHKAAQGLNKKFPDLAAIRPRALSEIVRQVQATRPKYRKASTTSYRGGAFIGPVFKTRQSTDIPKFRLLNPKQSFKQAGKYLSQPDKKPMPQPMLANIEKKGWPEAAVIDWEVWGERQPVRFFMKWPELKP